MTGRRERDSFPASFLLLCEGQCPLGSKSTDLGSCFHQWAYPAHTRGSFRFTTKGTKGVPGLCPWTPPEGGTLFPPCGVAAPPK